MPHNQILIALFILTIAVNLTRPYDNKARGLSVLQSFCLEFRRLPCFGFLLLGIIVTMDKIMQ